MRFRRWLWVLLACGGVLLLATQSRTIWLPWIAQGLIVEDELRSAEVIVVFAGEFRERAEHAARLYRAGLAPRIVVTGELLSRDLALLCHRRVTGAEIMAEVLTDAGVPEAAVQVLARGTSTYEEGQAMRAFMTTHGYRSLIATSSPYHMRRVKATLDHLLRDTEINVQYSPAQGGEFKVESWWQSERDLIHVANEYLKLLYYHLALFS